MQEELALLPIPRLELGNNEHIQIRDMFAKLKKLGNLDDILHHTQQLITKLKDYARTNPRREAQEETLQA